MSRDVGEARDHARDVRRGVHQVRARQPEAAVLRAQPRLAVDAPRVPSLGELEAARRRLRRVGEQHSE